MSVGEKKYSLTRSWVVLLQGLIIILCILHGYSAFSQDLISDEIETASTAKFISDGRVIFRDFFQHHGIIAYYLFTPPFLVTDDVASAIYLMKFMALAIFFVFLGLIYTLTRQIFKGVSGEWRLLSNVILFIFLSDIIWWRFGTQIRTDVILCTFFLAGLICMHQTQKTENLKYMFLAGVFASLAFLTKQTAALFFGVFTPVFLGFRWRDYASFIAGFVVASSALILPFILAGGIGDFIDYFLLFNLEKLDRGVFNLYERCWFINSDMPFYVGTTYYFGFFLITALVFLNGSVMLGRFYKALVMSGYICLVLTFMWSTPYPQYYMPVQVLLFFAGLYHLDHMIKKIRHSAVLLSVLILSMSSISLYYLGTIGWGVGERTLTKQVAAISYLSENIPSSTAIIGLNHITITHGPPGFYWYYPPIFIDKDMSHLNRYLDTADLVFYEVGLFQLAPSEFRERVTNNWTFVGAYYLPFFTPVNQSIVSVYAKDPGFAEQLRTNLRQAPFRQLDGAKYPLNHPILVPVAFRITALYDDKAQSLGPGRHVLQSKGNISGLRVFASANSLDLDGVINFNFQSKPNLNVAYSDKKIVLSAEYVEFYHGPRNTTDESLIFFKYLRGQQPTYLGVVEVNMSEQPSGYTVSSVDSRVNLDIEFNSSQIILDVGNFERRVF